MSRYVIGVDYGSDSCRAIVVDALTGKIEVEASRCYPRWTEGRYCNPSADRYRQHPLDYIETFEGVIRELGAKVGLEVMSSVEGISFDTTASTPVLVDRSGTPLALRPEFSEDPDAMFVLWKDHTAKEEAEEINRLAKEYEVDYTAYSGGSYSAEWAWSKVLHILRTNKRVAEAAWSWFEHCDWMTAYLVGNTVPESVARSRCAAGHKAMWRAEWGGLPSEDFLSRIDPALGRMRATFDQNTKTADYCAGAIREDLAEKLGLPKGMKVGLGAIDAHVGAVGAAISGNVLTRIMGTSTCDILVCDKDEAGDRMIDGICGQVDGSVIPGMIGFEAGQSAFGDVYAWFRRLLMWPVEKLLPDQRESVKDKILSSLEEDALKVSDEESTTLALDWFNGRRTPDADISVKGALTELTLGTTAPMIYKALVQATAFGSRAIVERFVSEGVNIQSVLAIGGISQKSPFVMQTLADVMGMPISVVDCGQACALGASMFAAVVAGIYPTVQEAQQGMKAPLGRTYYPDASRREIIDKAYARYKLLGKFEESTH